MKTLLCNCVKNENVYLREWVEFYKDYGFTNIVLYDNNDLNGEYPQQVIGDYISNGYVIYVDKRGERNIQYDAYKECYDSFGKDYEWMAVFDTDEFIETNIYDRIDNLIKGVINADKETERIFVTWKRMTDSNLVHYDGRKVLERFTEDSGPDNFVFKGIYKTDINRDIIERSSKYVNFFVDPYICLRHYETKTIEEFFLRKFGNYTYANDEIMFTPNNLEENKDYFKHEFIRFGNKWSDEKEKVYNELFENYKKHYLKHFDYLPEKLAITMVCNDNYFRLANICIKSFLKHNNWFNGDIIIIHDDGSRCGLSEETKDKFKALYGKVKFFEVNPHDYDNLIEHFKPFTPSKLFSSFYKLDIFNFEGYDRILQIDGDMLFLDDISDMFKFNHEFMACEEYEMFRERVVTELPNNNRVRTDDNLNCGLFVLNKVILGKKLKEELIRFGENMDLTVRCKYSPHEEKFVEQDLLNVYFYGKDAFVISNEYNMPKSNFWNGYYFNVVPKCKVIHYLDDKPYDHRPELSKINEIWLKFEKEYG